MPDFFLDTSEISNLAVAKPVGSGKLVRGCTMCGLKHKCKSPMMNPFGNGGKEIVIVGEAPGEDEDKIGRQFVGRAGKEQRECLEKVGIDVDMDCTLTNVVQCHPEHNKFPGKDVVDNCSLRLEKQLRELKPKLIIASGFHAIKAVLKPPFSFTVNKMRGRIVPSQKYGCWVACVYHPSYVLRVEQDDIRSVYLWDLMVSVKKIDVPLPTPLDTSSFVLVDKVDDVVSFLQKISLSQHPVTFDYETTCLSPFDEGAKILSVSFSTDPSMGHCIPLGYDGCWTEDELDKINEALIKFLISDVSKSVHNSEFERLWTQVIYNVHIGGYVWDTMNCAHVENEMPGTCSLEFQVFTRFGATFKKMVDHTRLASEPLKNLARYNCLDSRYQMWVYLQQLTMGKGLSSACRFFNENCGCLTDMKQRGMKVDFTIIKKMSKELADKIEQYESELLNLDVIKKYNVDEKKPFNSGAAQDVAKILYDYLDAPFVGNVTEKGNVSVDANFIEAIVKKAEEDRLSKAMTIKVFSDLILNLRKNKKQKSTYVDNLFELADKYGIIHPSYLLHIARTYRSSSRDPNFQNFPKRDPELRKIRRAFIPYVGDLFIEIDFEGAEICVMAMLSDDRLLIQQLHDGLDIHRKWASELYAVAPEDITKEQRFDAKNGFVFPEFYGSWHKPIAESISLPVDHVKDVETIFWHEHPGIKAYQRSEFDTYIKNGYVETPLGFRRHAPLTRNEIINSKIQGTAFHLLLAGCQAAEYEMRKAGLKSVIINEIHDSVLVDTCADEIDVVVPILERCLTKQHFDWMQGVQMKVSMAIGENWLEMEDV